MSQHGSGTMRGLVEGDAMLWMHGGKQVNIPDVRVLSDFILVPVSTVT